jgi:hypothetical protein
MMTPEQVRNSSGAAIGFIIAVVLFVAIGVIAKLSIQAPALDADRAAERSKALAEIIAAEEKSLNTAAVIDYQRGIVRLPIETAMQVTAQSGANPSAARADLKSRAEKATAPVKAISFE